MQGKSRISAAMVAALAIAGLAGCGGGGSGSADAGDPVLPSAAKITEANYEGVARQSLVAASYIADTGSLITGAQVAPGPQALLAFARAQMQRLPGRLASSRAVVTGVTATNRFDCTGGGSITTQETDANNNGAVDAGDGGRVTAQNCVESGVTLNGSIAVAFTAASGDFNSDRYSGTATITLEALRVASQAGSATGSGAFVLSINSTDALTQSVSMTVTSLAVSGIFGGTSDTLTMQNFSVATSSALVGGRLRSSTTVNGSVGSQTLAGGTVDLFTVQPLVQFEGDLYPSSGMVRATGAAGSRVRMTVMNSTNVLLELDANGDGNDETSTVRTWASLV